MRGTDDDYDFEHPRARDLLLLLEVADGSLVSDRTTKARIYAETGAPVYWILNVPDRRLEIRTDPDADAGVYRSTVTLTATDVATLPLPGGDVELPLTDLLG